MSDREPDMALRDLPQPKSPSALDERILAAAREQAPARRQSLALTWMGGLASACVLVLGVMLTGVLTTSPYRTVEQDDAREDIVAARPRYDASMGVSDTLTQGAALQRRALPREEVTVAETPVASAESSAGLEADRARATGGKAKAASPRIAAYSMVGTLDKLTENATARHLSAEEQANDLRFCEQFLKEEEHKLAERCYALLRERCPPCKLPDTLEMALEQLEPQKK